MCVTINYLLGAQYAHNRLIKIALGQKKVLNFLENL